MSRIDHGVYLNIVGTKISNEVYRGPKSWCLRYMKDHRRDQGDHGIFVCRSLATTARIRAVLGLDRKKS